MAKRRIKDNSKAGVNKFLKENLFDVNTNKKPLPIKTNHRGRRDNQKNDKDNNKP